MRIGTDRARFAAEPYTAGAPAGTTRRFTRPIVLMTSAVLAAAAARAGTLSDMSAIGELAEVIVTAEKRAESLQDVPVSIQTLDQEQLTNLRITGLDGYTKYLTSVSTQNYGPGNAQLYVRGVTNGADGLPVGSQPLVGLYLDEMPVTTIGNSLDLHLFDIERIEQLSGPQGTLFGASSMAGTVRIITNKPNADRFSAGYQLETNSYTAGTSGGTLDGFVNVPLSPSAAIRIVAFAEHDGGYINNVIGPAETYPTSGLPRTNTDLARQHFNTVDTAGARAALQIALGDHWTILPGAIVQTQDARGVAGFNPAEGDLNISRYIRDDSKDRWWQASLVVEGKYSDFDIVYAAGLLRRNLTSISDYTDYQYLYDQYYETAYAGTSSATYWGDKYRNNAGQLIAPAEYARFVSNYGKQSQELRISTPKDRRIRAVAGLFLQRQSNDWRAEFWIPGLADQYSITNQPGLDYLNELRRTDRDKAAFVDLNAKVTNALTASAGIREFAFDNTVYGFFGFNGQPDYNGYTNPNGEQLCIPGSQNRGTYWPCVNVDSRATDRGETHRFNLEYRLAAQAMMYATLSSGFRPGGVNRVHTRPSYEPDYLTNFEAGWKTEWFNRRLRVNGAVFYERWRNAQFTVTGPTFVAELLNAGGARVKGVETSVEWAATSALSLSAAFTALDARLTQNACVFASPSYTCTEPLVVQNADGSTQDVPNKPIAITGTRLPVSPRFKGNLVARYEFKAVGLASYLQAAVVGQSNVVPVLQTSLASQVG